MFETIVQPNEKVIQGHIKVVSSMIPNTPIRRVNQRFLGRQRITPYLLTVYHTV